MHDLRELQIDFQNYLLKQNSNIQQHIISTENVPAVARLGIYRDAYYLRLIEVLQNDYPVLHAMLGDEEFDQLCRKYIDSYPSAFRSARWYGQELKSFLKTTEPYSNHSYLSEMADFEWLLTEAFDAADGAIMSLDDIAIIPPEKWPEMRFTINPALRRINLFWNVVAIWEAHNQNQELAPTQSEVSTNWMIWRRDLQIHFYSLPVDEAYMIDAIIKGDHFGSICEGLCEWIDELNVSMHAATLLKRFILDGLVIDAVY